MHKFLTSQLKKYFGDNFTIPDEWKGFIEDVDNLYSQLDKGLKVPGLELNKNMSEIEKLNKFMLGREERIIEVKQEVNELLRQLGQPPRYKV